MSSLTRGIRQLAAGTFLSRLSGLLRDVMLAAVFGTGEALAGFMIAFTAPNLLRRLLGEGALAEAAVPVFAEREKAAGRAAAFALVNRLLLLAVGVLLLGCAAAVAVTPCIDWLLTLPVFPEAASDFVAEPRTQTALELLPMIMPYCVFVCIGGFIGGILHALGHFRIPALAPAFLNFAFIAAACWISSVALDLAIGVKVLTAAVLIAGFLQLAAVSVVLWRFGWRPGLGAAPGILRVLRLMGVLAFGASLAQINVAIDRMLAIWLGAGAVTGLYFAERLVYLPVGLLGVAAASAALPKLAHASAAGDDKDAAEILAYCLRISIALTIPAAIFLGVLREPIVRLLFMRGEFGADSLAATTVAIAAYAAGIPFFVAAKPVRAAFIGRADARTPVLVGLLCLVVNFFLNLILMQSLEHAGLALATVIAGILNLVILGALVWRLAPQYADQLRQLPRLAAAAIVAALPAGIGAAVAAARVPPTKAAALLLLIAAGAIGGLLYFAILQRLAPVLGKELRHLARRP